MITWKMIDQHISLILNLTLAAAAAVIVLVLLPMMYRLQGFDGQEGILAKDSSLVNGLISAQEKVHPQAPMIVFTEASKVVQEIVDLGNQDSITFISMINQDKAKIAYKKISTLPVELEVQGSFRQLGVFMGDLNDLRRGIVLIDSFEIKKESPETDNVKAKVLLYICLKSPPKTTKPPKDTVASHQQALSFINEYSLGKLPSGSDMDWGKRDPFDPGVIILKGIGVKPVMEAIKNDFAYHLIGIFWNEEKPSAIINGLVVDTGSKIGPSTVKKINPGEVILFDGKKNIFLELRAAERI